MSFQFTLGRFLAHEFPDQKVGISRSQNSETAAVASSLHTLIKFLLSNKLMKFSYYYAKLVWWKNNTKASNVLSRFCTLIKMKNFLCCWICLLFSHGCIWQFSLLTEQRKGCQKKFMQTAKINFSSV